MSEPQMTKEQLDEIEAACDRTTTVWESPLKLPKGLGKQLVALAREGLRLREPPVDGDYLRQLHKEFDCGCETCARTAAVCPATASALFQEVAILREHRDSLTAELDSLRKDKERLDWLDSLPDKTEFTPSEYGTTIRTAIDSAMRKDGGK